MPPITTTIRARPHDASRSARQRSSQLARGSRGSARRRAIPQFVNPSNRASTSPGNTPAANSLPTDVLVETANSTITIDGGTRMPRAPLVVITPAANRFGNPRWTISGRMIEPIATTVATEEPQIAANNAQARTPARPRPPYQCPIIDVAKAIMRRATPPVVRKLPARMKNGIAMISKRSRLVKSLRPTILGSTLLRTNR